MASAKHEPSVMQKIVLSVIHGIERRVNNESLNQMGQTTYEIIHKKDLMTVLRFLPLEEPFITVKEKEIPVVQQRYRIPLVFVPPLLAPGFLFDLFRERSLARFFLAKGFEVYLIDLGNPDKSHKHLSFEDYILDWMPSAMESIRKDSGQEELTLFGYCMGGLFSMMYTAVEQDDNIKNLVTIASPIDIHSMGAAGKMLSAIGGPVVRLSRVFNFELKDVNPGLLHIPGRLGTFGFHMLNPLGQLTSYWDLLLNLWDREYLTARESLGEWINNLLDYPGATVQQIIAQMAIKNKLARGTMRIGDREARFENIHCALLSFAGDSDEIVPIKVAHKITSIVSSEDKEFCVVPGGHVGVIIGGKAPDHLWEISAEWLAQRSG